MKENIRIILHARDPEFVNHQLALWVSETRQSGIAGFDALANKIERNSEFIVNTVRCRMSNARIESTNNKIKLIIRRAFGFRNIQYLIDMVLLVCSNLPVRLPYRRPA